MALLTFHNFTARNLLYEGATLKAHGDNGEDIVIEYSRDPEIFFSATRQLAPRRMIFSTGFFWDPRDERCVTEEILTGRNFSPLRLLSNRVKKSMFSSLRGRRVRKLLSIGTGRGGDIWKWISIGVKEVLIVEPDAGNRRELKRRLSYCRGRLRWRILGVPGQDIHKIITEVHRFFKGEADAVEFMLSMTFFNFESEREIGYLISLARMGRYLIVISPERDLVLKSLRRNPSQRCMKLEQKGIVRGELTPRAGYSERSESLEVSIPGTIVGSKQEEYLVRMGELTRRLCRRRFLMMGNLLKPGEPALLTQEGRALAETYAYFVLEHDIYG